MPNQSIAGANHWPLRGKDEVGTKLGAPPAVAYLFDS